MNNKMPGLSQSFTFVLITILFFLYIVLSLPSVDVKVFSEDEGRLVPALFVFGDSVIDNGNNVFLPNKEAKYDFLPYGVDFPEGPTGRLTNGRNPSDFMAQLLHLPGFLPPAMNPQTKGVRILHGVNFASGGSGILDSTADISVCISMNQQIEHFKTVTLADLRSQLGNKKVRLSSFLSKSIFMFNAGGNDCSGMCSGRSTGSGQCPSDEFLDYLLGNFTQQLKEVYALGARKFVLFGVQAIGCTPFAREAASNGKEGCIDEMNHAAITFNTRLRSSLFNGSYEKEMTDSRFVYVDTYKIVRDAFDNPLPLGFKVTNKTCCMLNEKKMCMEGGIPCKDRNSYMYFDGVHFTETLYEHLSRKAYFSILDSEVYPYNVAHLVGHPLGSMASYAYTKSYASS